MTETLQMDDAPVLSASAAARVKAIAEKQGRPAQLRLTVDGGGCSGFTYRFGMADSVEADDVVTERDGVQLVVDNISLDLLRGSEIDFVDNLGGSSFRVTNPQAVAGCGCGTSFAI